MSQRERERKLGNDFERWWMGRKKQYFALMRNKNNFFKEGGSNALTFPINDIFEQGGGGYSSKIFAEDLQVVRPMTCNISAYTYCKFDDPV